MRHLVPKTATLLDGIVTHAHGLQELANDVAHASKEQSAGIDQVDQAVTALDRVTRRDAAASEEGATAAQQLKSQATTLTEAVIELRALIHGTCQRSSFPVRATAIHPFHTSENTRRSLWITRRHR
ncbi:MAG: hypothetical protein QM813_04665 [Verrucomicrobiota bacterium]